ncbi:hypothetical protein KKF34_16190 [Myxococcota bacterium]|nr:hypothetical protein [Myxococcota bacterium]MBU1381397.1 hypothetical protein [Myxococcota bacterium]MBU1498417.1 hypothetical protein [Myxococcota bacterium]
MPIDKTLLDKIGEKGKKKLSPLVDRYVAFTGKINERVAEIRAEADAGMDELIKANPVDYGPISAGFSSITARFRALGNKVSQAVEKLEEEWEQLLEDCNLKNKELSRANLLWSQVITDSRDLQDRLEREGNYLEVRKGADWARILYSEMQKEQGLVVNCPQCGAGLPSKIRHAAMNETCGHCGSVNEIYAHPFTGAYFGTGVHNLSLEASLDEYWKMLDGEKKYQWYRHQSESDRQEYIKTVENYWLKYYTAYNSMHVAPSRTVEESVDAKLSHYRTNIWSNANDEKERADIEKILTLVAQGQVAQALDFVRNSPHIDASEAVTAVYEHGNLQGTEYFLAVWFERKNKSPILTISPAGISLNPHPEFEEWKKKKLIDLEYQLASR